MDHIYDVIILGRRSGGIKRRIICRQKQTGYPDHRKGQAGGQIINTDEIENYPGQNRRRRDGSFSCNAECTNRQNSSAQNMSVIRSQMQNERRYQSPDRRKRYVSGEKYHHRNRCIRKTDRMQR